MIRPRTAAFFAPVLFAYAVAAWCLVALAWDGAGYAFNRLQAGAPVIAHHRYSNFPILLAVVEAGRFTDNARALGVLYGLLLAAIPVGSLALSFHFLRRPPLDCLRVWFALGILWSALPGEICLMSEASLAVQIFWAALAFVAAGCPARGSAWMLLLSPGLFFLHPTSAVLFAILAVLCAGVAWQAKARNAWGWGCAFSLLALARLGFSAATATPYEIGELGFEPNRLAFLGAIWNWPAGMLAFLYLFAGVWLLRGLRRLQPRLASGLAWLFAIAFLLCGAWWAHDSRLWAGAISYRRFVLVCTLPLAAAAAAHWVLLRRRPEPLLPSWCLPLVAAVFGIVYAVQSLSWRMDVARLSRALEASDQPFVTLVDQPWIKRRALDHWGTSMLSAILQGANPRVLYAESPDRIQGDSIRLFPGGWLRKEEGWFFRANAASQSR